MKELKRRGLKTKETDKFLKFWSVVQEAAFKQHSVFFLSVGEGRELHGEDLEGEDLSGWLIPTFQSDEFEKKWLNNEDLVKWNDFVCFAVWKITNGNIEIDFQKY